MVCKDVKAGKDTWGKRWRRQSRHSFLYQTITFHYLLRTVWYTFINYDSANGISRIGARMPLSLIHSSCFCIDWRGMADRRVQPRLRDNLKVMHECKRGFDKTHEEQKCWCLFWCRDHPFRLNTSPAISPDAGSASISTLSREGSRLEGSRADMPSIWLVMLCDWHAISNEWFLLLLFLKN